MKKKILIWIVFIAFSSFTGFSKYANINQNNIAKPECKYGQCSFIKSNKEQCKNCNQKNKYYCYTHRDT